ncbi:SAV_915 family protein [Streptomyces phytohabitans]|uniref:SAV_915 family protein n=1 Tax=Streptomyces phytohabitans TaxID=1150371 RepID=UPI00345BE60C
MAAPLQDGDPASRDALPPGPLYVPVRRGPHGDVTRLFRTATGARTAVAFTSVVRLTSALGADQAWVRLAGPALRALIRPLGVAAVTLDPQLTAPAPAPERCGEVPPTRRVPGRDVPGRDLPGCRSAVAERP